MEFSKVFFRTNGIALFCTKKTERIEPYHLICSFWCQWAGDWVRTNKKHGGWTACRVMTFSRKVIFLEEKTTISSFWLLQHLYLQGEIWIHSLEILSNDSNTTDEKRHTLHQRTFWKSAAVFQIFSILFRKYCREQPGTGKCVQMVKKIPGIPIKARKTEYLERYYLFSENILPGWTVPFKFSPECRKCHWNGKRSIIGLSQVPRLA